jgi:hypothetical protein
MSGPEMPVGIGNVLRVGESDYMYGTGPLILRVTQIGGLTQLSDGPWVNLDGTELRADGTVFRPEPRHVLVRLQALRRRSPRPGDQRP